MFPVPCSTVSARWPIAWLLSPTRGHVVILCRKVSIPRPMGNNAVALRCRIPFPACVVRPSIFRSLTRPQTSHSPVARQRGPLCRLGPCVGACSGAGRLRHACPGVIAKAAAPGARATVLRGASRQDGRGSAAWVTNRRPSVLDDAVRHDGGTAPVAGPAASTLG